MYYLEWEELGGVIVNNRVTEEIIKITFGDNWLIAAFVFVVAVSAIRFIRKNNLPKYFRKCLIVCVCAIAALIDSKFFQWNEYLGALRIRKVFPLLLLTVIVVTIAIFIYSYMKNDKQLKYVIKNTESDGNIIKAWERLQKIKTINLTPWQKRQYDKRRLYLRVMLGNMCGAEQELKKFENDKAFYHFTKAIIFNFRGNHKDELEEEKIAEGYCDGDTDSFLHFQIISNRGAGYVGAGEYSLANDWFKRAIDFGRVNNVKAPDLWLNLYYNYVFNKTRLNLDISIQECIDMLEEVKQYIDIEDPKQYIGYRNIVIQLFRQKKADKMQLNEIINQDFECVEMKSGKMLQGNIVEAGDIESAWLVIPPLQMKIKCNGMLAGKMLGQGFLFSKWENTELRYCNVNTIVPEVRSAIERIIEMIKAELPDSLVTSAELNRLAKNEI